MKAPMARDDRDSMKPVKETLSVCIQGLRKERAWSQDQLAGASNLSLRTIQRVENGKGASPETVQALAAAFEVETNVLTSCLEDPPKSNNKITIGGIDFSPKQATLWVLGLLAVIAVLLWAEGRYHFIKHIFQ